MTDGEWGPQGVAFTIMHKRKGCYGAKFVTGNGFVVARAQKAKARRKTFMHWADDTFRCLLFPLPNYKTHKSLSSPFGMLQRPREIDYLDFYTCI